MECFEAQNRSRACEDARILHMGKDLLSNEQREILELASKDPKVTDQFYLTGGTALSHFYFKHRFSEDLDFFSEREFNPKILLSSISQIADKLKTKKVEQQSLSGQEIFYFYFSDKFFVKVDFAYFPFIPLGNFKKFNSIRVSSIEDIAVNKLHAIITRKRARDYFDLYLCMEKLKWEINDLTKNYRLKFDIVLPKEQLATSFLNVLDAQDEPKFLGHWNFEAVTKFFLKITDELKKEIIK